MDYFESLASRNAEFAEESFRPELKMLPHKRAVIIGCVDPRVDPVEIFKLEQGEAAVIRNVGGRVNEEIVETIDILGAVAKAAGKEVGEGWNLVVLHHTDCGIKGCYNNAPDLLAKYMQVPTEELEELAVMDPYKAVEIDVRALREASEVPSGFTIAGLVYDVATGKVETVVPPARLRD
jgi:carbonic anhydrase